MQRLCKHVVTSIFGHLWVCAWLQPYAGRNLSKTTGLIFLEIIYDCPPLSPLYFLSPHLFLVHSDYIHQKSISFSRNRCAFVTGRVQINLKPTDRVDSNLQFCVICEISLFFFLKIFLTAKKDSSCKFCKCIFQIRGTPLKTKY